ncbi:MAG: TetR/AcrR family transcriptional regulator C-terminal domain-containing protein [Chloroflexi bacterium]|nr:TetR/AcrR family transcriptional regulator C-terminal domain-containing protein [Chloroflexota bacterium]
MSSDKPPPRSLDLVWARPDRPRAGLRPALSRDQIVRSAIELADSEGIAALSIRKLATRLGAGAMSLYWYVASKDDLIDLLLDAVYGEADLPQHPSGDWRSDLGDVARGTRVLMHRHPWIAALVGNRALLGPNALRRIDYSLATLDPIGVDVSTMMGLLGAINAYVTGFVLNELGEAETRRRTGLSDEEFRLSAAPYVQEQVIASGRYPHLARYVMEGEDRDADAEFAFGLNCLLDGIAAFKATSRS